MECCEICKIVHTMQHKACICVAQGLKLSSNQYLTLQLTVLCRCGVVSFGMQGKIMEQERIVRVLLLDGRHVMHVARA